jgi:putative transcriptional regulator
MIRVHLKALLEEKSFQEKRRITLNEVSEKTGVSRPTLNRIANIPGYNTNTETIDSLCRYFACTPCDLLEFIEETGEENYR